MPSKKSVDRYQPTMAPVDKIDPGQRIMNQDNRNKTKIHIIYNEKIFACSCDTPRVYNTIRIGFAMNAFQFTSFLFRYINILYPAFRDKIFICFKSSLKPLLGLRSPSIPSAFVFLFGLSILSISVHSKLTGLRVLGENE